MELVSTLKNKLHRAEMDMYNSEYPSEFNDILSKTVYFGDRDWTWEEMLDRYPEHIPSLIEKGFLTFGSLTRDFKIYAYDMFKMRINHYCPIGESWKEFVNKTNHSNSDSDYNDNYSKHEMT